MGFCAWRWKGHQTGISFLAFRRLKIYTHLRPSEYNVFSEKTISSERPFRGPLKPYRRQRSLNEGRGVNPGDTRIPTCRCVSDISRSTKAGA